jgi:tetratricopeptide (TPR) repeat protein
MAGLLVCAQATAQPATATDVPSPPQLGLQPDPLQPALYIQALRALAQNQPAEAQELLQSVVNQYPDLAGAWLDLALLALQQSHYPEADEYLIALEQKFAPLPPEIAQAVARMRERVNAQLQPGANPGSATHPKSQTALVMGSGYENNANSGLRMSTITLTTPDGDAILTVDPASQPKSSAYVRAGLVHQVTQSWLGGELNWQVQGQTRQYNSLSQYSNMELLPQVTATHPQLLGQITAGWQAIWLNNRGAYQTPILRWQLDRTLAQCNWRNQIQAEERQYQQAGQLDSHWLAYRSTWQCQSGATRRQVYVQLAQENATHANRPGGNTHHQSLGVQQEWLNALGHEGHIVQAKADWLHAQDSGAYNSLLDHGNPRHLNRVDAQLSWSAPVVMQPGWRWSVSAQTNAQTSNVAFFNQRNFSLETSLWRAW